jgi:hypothetical protein
MTVLRSGQMLMRPLNDKNEFQAGGSENESGAGQLSQESSDREMEGELSEEELAAGVEEFNRAEGVPEFPDNEEAAKIPDLKRPHWLARVISCICGIVFATAIAGLLIDRWPKAVQLSRFLTLIAVLAPTIAIVGHWVFVTHPNQIAEKLAREEQERNPVMADDGRRN